MLVRSVTAMKKFRLFIKGVNFILRNEKGKNERRGFYTNRYVEAESPEIAENIAIDLISDELRDRIQNTRDNPPIMNVTEIVELSSFEDALVPGKGFTWWVES